MSFQARITNFGVEKLAFNSLQSTSERQTSVSSVTATSNFPRERPPEIGFQWPRLFLAVIGCKEPCMSPRLRPIQHTPPTAAKSVLKWRTH
jgi:hypothetical protein